MQQQEPQGDFEQAKAKEKVFVRARLENGLQAVVVGHPGAVQEASARGYIKGEYEKIERVDGNCLMLAIPAESLLVYGVLTANRRLFCLH